MIYFRKIVSILLLTLLLSGCGISSVIKNANNQVNQNSYIETVKSGYLDDWPNQVLGDAFENFFSNTDWTYFKSESGEHVVEFTGSCIYMETKVKALLQFHVKEDNRFEIGALTYNDIPQDIISTNALLYAVFEGSWDYQEVTNEPEEDESDETATEVVAEPAWDSSVVDIALSSHNVDYATGLISSGNYPDSNTMMDSNELNQLFGNADIASLIGTEITFIGLPFAVDNSTDYKGIRSSIDFLIEGASRADNLNINVLSVKTDGLGVLPHNPYVASGYIVGSKKFVYEYEHGESEYSIPSVVVEDIHPFSYEEYEYGYKGGLQNDEYYVDQGTPVANPTGKELLSDIMYTDPNYRPKSQLEHALYDAIFEYYGKALDKALEERAPKTEAEIRLTAISNTADVFMLEVDHLPFYDKLTEDDKENFKNIQDTFQFFFDEIERYKKQYKEWKTVKLWDGTTIGSLLADLKETKERHDNNIKEFYSPKIEKNIARLKLDADNFSKNIRTGVDLTPDSALDLVVEAGAHLVGVHFEIITDKDFNSTYQKSIAATEKTISTYLKDLKQAIITVAKDPKWDIWEGGSGWLDFDYVLEELNQYQEAFEKAKTSKG